MQHIFAVLPEFILLVFACLALMSSMIDRQGNLAYWISQTGLICVIATAIFAQEMMPNMAFYDSLINDSMSLFLKIVTCFSVLIVFNYSYHYLKDCRCLSGEYFTLGLFAVIGMMTMISGYHLLSIYLGMELLSLSLYAMIAMVNRLPQTPESAVKYFILGAIGSGLLLYGISMFYGLTGAFNLAEINEALSTDPKSRMLLIYALVFMIIGIAFKLGAAPFHMWVPDVYQGAAAPVGLFIATAPKIAAFAITYRILVDGLPFLIADWQIILSIIAVLSMAIGNIIAIAQKNIKRMLAYSAIAHSGYLLLGFIAGTSLGFSAAMFYSVSYALMSMGAFGVIILLGLGQDREQDKLSDFKGLSQRHPWLGLIMLFLMFSMAGIPPFLGFWSKWFVLKELIHTGFVTLAVATLLFSVIGAYYYLRVIKLIYFDSPESPAYELIHSSKRMYILLSLNGLLILFIGIFPSTLLNLCINALNW